MAGEVVHDHSAVMDGNIVDHKENWQVEADAVQDHHHKDTGHRHTVRT